MAHPGFPAWRHKLRPVETTGDELVSSVTVLRGFSFLAGASGAQVDFLHGSDSGDLLHTLALDEGQSATLVLLIPIGTPDGVYVDVVSGSLEKGVLYG